MGCGVKIARLSSFSTPIRDAIFAASSARTSGVRSRSAQRKAEPSSATYPEVVLELMSANWRSREDSNGIAFWSQSDPLGVMCAAGGVAAKRGILIIRFYARQSRMSAIRTMSVSGADCAGPRVPSPVEPLAAADAPWDASCRGLRMAGVFGGHVSSVACSHPGGRRPSGCLFFPDPPA
jgi:hypothetical protein